MPAPHPNPERLRRLRPLAGELGALGLVWLGDATGLQSYALPATLAVIGIDALRRWRGHIGFPTIWFVFNGMALGFGVLTLTIARWLSPENFGALCAFLSGVRISCRQPDAYLAYPGTCRAEAGREFWK